MTVQLENGQHRIVVGVDGSVPSKAALAWALRQARLTAAAVEAVIAWEFPSVTRYPVLVSDVDWEDVATRALSDAIADVAASAQDVKIATKVKRGNAAHRQPGSRRVRRGPARVDRPALRPSRHLPGRGDPRLGHGPPGGTSAGLTADTGSSGWTSSGWLAA